MQSCVTLSFLFVSLSCLAGVGEALQILPDAPNCDTIKTSLIPYQIKLTKDLSVWRETHTIQMARHPSGSRRRFVRSRPFVLILQTQSHRAERLSHQYPTASSYQGSSLPPPSSIQRRNMKASTRSRRMADSIRTTF